MSLNTFDPAAAGDRVVIRWFVGLGAGTQPDQIPLEEEAVRKFNESQDKIYLALELVENSQAYNILATRIASGDVPDIIGPVGVRGRNAFKGQLLDLSELIKKHNIDLSVYDTELVDFYNLEGQGQIGLPYAIYPSFIYFNKDLFDEADLPYPPQTYGEQYDGKEWNMDTLRELGMKLTVDENGNDATSPDFDPEKIVQFGFHPQWNNQARNVGTLFGAGSLVGPDGNAQIPEHWLAAWEWYHAGMFKDYFIPHDAYVNSDAFGNSNVFNSGKLAMAWTHLWYTCCLNDVENWDIAVMPSYNGKPTAKLHADTFSIMKASKHPEEAFEVLLYLLQSPELTQAYGAMPADKTRQDEFFANLDKRFAETNKSKVNWQVAIDSLNYVDDPNHEEDLPNFLKVQNELDAFANAMRTQPDFDVKAEAEKLKETLQKLFDEVN
ncbi:MAG: sugar ABC transporter substrate-binding protein [Herpetosiphonaceae bacterium]|nr:MAG: sugar ABC transporter substrate-binding protein [Herpetosiphonaceae bacterium]